MNAIRLVSILAAVTVMLVTTVPTVLADWPPPGDDAFGIYHWNDDLDQYVPYVMVGMAEVATLTYFLTGVTAPSLGGFECRLSIEPAGAVVLVDQGLPPGAINFGTFPEYIVGFAAPVPIETGNGILCIPSFLNLVVDPVYVSVGPTSIPTIPGAMAYVEYDDVSMVHEMFPVSGSFDLPVFSFNDQIVAAEGRSWSALKSLYR